jgi:hypothetical protein
MRLRHLAVSAASVVLLAGCSAGSSAAPSSAGATSAPASSAVAGGPRVLPRIVSSELGVGENRVVAGLTDGSGTRPAGGPDTTVEIAFEGPNGEELRNVEAEFTWAIEDQVGVYTAPAEFPTAGAWKAHFDVTHPDALVEQVTFDFDVKDDTSVVRPGEPAPAADTPTADDVGGDLAQISTDDDPDPAFYERSVADALDAGEPFVLAFATPKFCATQACGPTLDRLKPVAEEYPDVAFINVEPYQLELVEGQLQPVLDANGQLQPVEAVQEYGLLTEPYVFLVDGEGTITASFEAVVGEPELRTALDELTGATE